jgi:hypothetical protein
MTTGTYQIDDQSDGSYTLTVHHQCGHSMSYAYYLRQVVSAEAPQKAQSICGRCYSNAQIANKSKWSEKNDG